MNAKNRGVITVKVPIDLHAAGMSSCRAFAFATPMRIRSLIELAVREALGKRAPLDKIERSIRATLAGLRSGQFRVHVDGRPFEDADTVVVCGNVADVRFFLLPNAAKAAEPTNART